MTPDFFGLDSKILRQHMKTVLWEGILFLVLGLLAIAMPVLSSVAIDLFLGILFVVAGIAQLYRVVVTWGIRGTWPQLFWSLLSVIAGALMITRPMASLLALTTLLVAYFFLECIAKISFAIRFGAGSQKFWLFLNGILSLFLALIIFEGLPETAMWVLGLLVGINMALTGAMSIALYFSLRD